jgi:hypothetical protein
LAAVGFGNLVSESIEFVGMKVGGTCGRIDWALSVEYPASDKSDQIVSADSLIGRMRIVSPIGLAVPESERRPSVVVRTCLHYAEGSSGSSRRSSRRRRRGFQSNRQEFTIRFGSREFWDGRFGSNRRSVFLEHRQIYAKRLETRNPPIPFIDLFGRCARRRRIAQELCELPKLCYNFGSGDVGICRSIPVRKHCC